MYGVISEALYTGGICGTTTGGLVTGGAGGAGVGQALNNKTSTLILAMVNNNLVCFKANLLRLY